MSGLQGDQPIILKIGIDQSAIEKEAVCLQSFAGQGCVKLLKSDLRRGALLLECANPGHSLKSFFPKEDHLAIQATVQVMQQLHKAPFSTRQFPSLVQWLHELDKEWELPANYLEKARHLKYQLLATQGPPVLLHGDLHHDNILAHNQRYVALDPKGVIGESAYEVGAYLRNPIPDLMQHGDAKDIIARRIQGFATELSLNPQRLAQWNYVQAVLSACWKIADGLSPQPFLAYLEIIEED